MENQIASYISSKINEIKYQEMIIIIETLCLYEITNISQLKELPLQMLIDMGIRQEWAILLLPEKNSDETYPDQVQEIFQPPSLSFRSNNSASALTALELPQKIQDLLNFIPQNLKIVSTLKLINQQNLLNDKEEIIISLLQKFINESENEQQLILLDDLINQIASNKIGTSLVEQIIQMHFDQIPKFLENQNNIPSQTNTNHTQNNNNYKSDDKQYTSLMQTQQKQEKKVQPCEDKTLDEIFEESEQTYNQQRILLPYLFDMSTSIPIVAQEIVAIKETIQYITSDPKSIKDEVQLIKQQYQENKNIKFDINIQLLSLLILAIKNTSKIMARDVQLMSILLMLHANDKGRLLQIRTGEGKSTTTCILAAYKAIQGFKVDIITSQENLAIRDAIPNGNIYKFYQAVGLTCQDNSYRTDLKNEQLQVKASSPQSKKKSKKCYESNIVYGTTHSFSADFLQHDYAQKYTMGNRYENNTSWIIVDEVDNMLIDNKAHSTMLSQPSAGMIDLIKVMQWIWLRLDIDVRQLNCECKGIIQQEQSEVAAQIEGQQQFAEYLYEVIEAKIQDKTIKVPPYLYDYALSQLLKWCQSAVEVYFVYKRDKQYRVVKEEIKVVDEATGVTQENMQIQNGIHQFLQMKENLKISPECLTSNYISTITFFKKYGTNIYGLTGTMGSIYDQKLIAETYKTDFGYIPSFRKDQLIQLPALLALNHKHHLQVLKNNIMKQIHTGKAVLIICETILFAQLLNDEIQRQNQGNKIILYINNEQDIEQDEIQQGQIIISTNLAGRGTDIKTSKGVEDAGGLFVILAFLPCNLRIEQQAFGRTARKGNKGTCQLVIMIWKQLVMQMKPEQQQAIKMNSQTGQYNDFCKQIADIMIKARDEREEQSFNHTFPFIALMELKDNLFNEYCKCLSKKIRENPAFFQDVQDRFAIWLKQNENNTYEGLQLAFIPFKEQLEKEINNDAKDYVIQLPTNFSVAAGQFIQQEKFQEARDVVQQLLNADPDNVEASYQQIVIDVKEDKMNVENADLCIKNNQQKINQLEMQLQEIQVFEVIKDQIPNNQLNNNVVIENIQRQEEIDFQSDQEDQISRVQRLGAGLFDNREEQKQQQQRINFSENAIENLNQSNSFQVPRILPSQQNSNSIQNNNISIKQLEDEINSRKIFDSHLQNIKKCIGKSDIKFDVENLTTRGLSGQKLSEDFLSELQAKGLQKAIVIKQKPKKKRKWWGIVGLFTLGVLQAAAGIAIIAFSAGPGVKIGATLLVEGFKDMFYAIKAAYTGEDIDWKQWGIEKAFSVTTSVLLADAGALKDAKQALGQASKFSYKWVAAQVGKDALQKVAMNGQANLLKDVVKERVKAKANQQIYAKSVIDSGVLTVMANAQSNSKMGDFDLKQAQSAHKQVIQLYKVKISQEVKNNLELYALVCGNTIQNQQNYTEFIEKISKISANEIYEQKKDNIKNGIKNNYSSENNQAAQLNKIMLSPNDSFKDLIETCPELCTKINKYTKENAFGSPTQVENLQAKIINKFQNVLFENANQSLQNFKNKCNSHKTEGETIKKAFKQLELDYNNLKNTNNQQEIDAFNRRADDAKQRQERHDSASSQIQNEESQVLSQFTKNGNELIFELPIETKKQFLLLLSHLSNTNKVEYYGSVFKCNSNELKLAIDQWHSQSQIKFTNNELQAVKKVTSEACDTFHQNIDTNIQQFTKIAIKEVNYVLIERIFEDFTNDYQKHFEADFQNKLVQAWQTSQFKQEDM